nr:unnamed protein product [Callosobruchus chinensis]
MVNFMEAHPELNSGKFSSTFSKKTAENLWRQTSSELNSIPGSSKKEWAQWRKTWQDMKKKAKSKAVAYKRYAEGTGGGPSKIIKLDDVESKILDMIPSAVISGDKDVPVPTMEFVFGDVRS